MRTLRLISPVLMRGADVRIAQQLLDTNRFGDFLPGEVDGQFGAVTAAACVRAKRALGFPLKACTPEYGDTLAGYLSGRPLPASYRLRRAARRRSTTKALTRREALVRVALSQLGTREQPAGSNNVLYSRWYLDVARAPAWAFWCAMFVSWCCRGLFPFHSAFVPAIVADARAQRNGLSLAGSPVSGAFACFDWQGDGTADHIGICATPELLGRLAPGALGAAIARFGKPAAGEFWSIEGNTGVGNDSNGGEVMLRRRRRSDVAAFVLPSGKP